MANLSKIFSIMGVLFLLMGMGGASAGEISPYAWYSIFPNHVTPPPPASVSAAPPSASSPTPPTTSAVPPVAGSEDYVVKRGEFPFMVSLRGDYGHFCGGVLLTPSHVLTVARCITKFARKWNDQLTATTGILYQPEVSPANTVGIKRAIYHANFTDFDNNIAILKLTNATSGTFPGAPRSLSEPRDTAAVGQWLTAIGWGITGPQDYPMPSVPYQLYKTHLRLAKPEECNNAVGFSPVSSGQMCAVSNNLTVCKHDVGGPLVDMKTGKPKLVGLISHETPGCPVGGPVVLTSVRHYAEWISSAVDAADNPAKPFPQGKCLGDCGDSTKMQRYMIDFD